jgi:hypothetical protein
VPIWPLAFPEPPFMALALLDGWLAMPLAAADVGVVPGAWPALLAS